MMDFIRWLKNMEIAPKETSAQAYKTVIKELIEHFRRYRWHDIRKHPEDLPKTLNQVMICWLGGCNEWYECMFYNPEEKVFSVRSGSEWQEVHPIIGDTRFPAYGEAIAWREIEHFEEDCDEDDKR